jgi:hypothetical protein
MTRKRLLSLVAVLGCIALISLSAIYVAARPTIIQTQNGATRVKISTDHRMVLPGGCASLAWSIEQAQQVILDDQAVTSSGKVDLCPASTVLRTFQVTDAGGETRKYTIVVGVYLSTLTTRVLSVGVVVLIALVICFVAMIGDLPALTPIFRPLRLRIERYLIVLRTILHDLIRTRDFRYIAVLTAAAALKLILLRKVSWTHAPLIEIASLLFFAVLVLIWLKPHWPSVSRSTGNPAFKRRRSSAVRAVGICMVILLCAIGGFYLPMRSQFWMGGDEIHVLQDGIEGWSAIPRYDSTNNRPFTPLASILAAQLADTIDGYLWVALASRYLTALFLFGLTRALVGEDGLALVAAVLFVVNPSEPTRFLAVYMQGYNTTVLAAVASLSLFAYSHRRVNRVLLLVSCALLGVALSIVEAVFLLSILWPLIVFWRGARRPHTGVWVSGWAATVFLFAVRTLHFQLTASSSYQQSLIPTSFHFDQIATNFLRQLLPTLSFVHVNAASVDHWLVGALLFILCLAGVALLGGTKSGLVKRLIVAAAGSLVAIALSVLLFTLISGVHASIRTQFLAAPAQAVLWAVLLGSVSTRLPVSFRQVGVAVTTALLVLNTTAGAFEEQTHRLVNPAVRFEKTRSIVHQVLQIAPAVKPETKLAFTFNPETGTPLGWDYYVHDLSRYILGVDGFQLGYVDSLGIGNKLTQTGVTQIYGPDLSYLTRYDQLIAFDIDAAGTVRLLQTLPQSLLPAGPNEAYLYDPQARIIPGTTHYPRFFQK